MFLKFIFAYYGIVNMLLFFLMGYDKKRAMKNQWRISESTLFTIALLGGAIGGFAGMHCFHHKSKKPFFYIIFSAAILLHISFFFFLFKIIST